MSKQAILHITVSPKSSKRSITVNESNEIKVYLTSPPVDGKANSECISLFSKKLHTAKSNIILDKGLKGKKKKLIINDMTYDEVIELLKKLE